MTTAISCMSMSSTSMTKLLLLLLHLFASASAFRFDVGDRVDCHMGNDRWEPGSVERVEVEQRDEDMNLYTAAYAVTLDNGGTAVAPHDDDRFVRREGVIDTKKSARMLRFSVGAKVEANMGGYWATGKVTSINYRDDSFATGVTMPYEISLDMGGSVFAPEDDDSVIRAAGQLITHDPALRFAVGDRVECYFSDADGMSDDSSEGGGRWEEGTVVALHYHEERFGEGVTVPYQVKLDRGHRSLIFTPQDDESFIRRARSATAAAAAAATPPPPPPKAPPRNAGAKSFGGAESKMGKRRVGRRASEVGTRRSSKLRSSKLGGTPQKATAYKSAVPPPRAGVGSHGGGGREEVEPHPSLSAWASLTGASGD